MRSASTASARHAIVAAAFRAFGGGGIGTTSLREVARAAGVSPALVVHHFGGKDGLLAALDEEAVRHFADAYRSAEGEEAEALLRRRAAQTARVMAERPEVCAYLGRALVEGTAGSERLFAAMLAGGRAEIDALAAAGAIREDADRTWATLQHFFLIWAPLSFLPLLREALDGDLLEPEQLERWVGANVRLLEKGIYA